MRQVASKSIVLVWRKAPGKGRIETSNGRLVSPAAFPGSAARLDVKIADARLEAGAGAALVQVSTAGASFSFFLRDVTRAAPIWIEAYGVAVTESGDPRDYEELAADIRAKGLIGEAQRFADAPEETFEAAAARNRNLKCPTWLGLSRDMRIFHLSYQQERGYWGYIEPAYHFPPQAVPESDNRPMNILFSVGPGSSCRVRIERWLDERVLPILRSTQREDDVTYHVTIFATLETKPLSLKRLKGSDWRAVYPNTCGQMLSKEQLEAQKGLTEKEKHGREEEVVCCVRVEAVNSGAVPRYAWFKALSCHTALEPAYDGATGLSLMGRETKKAFGVNRLNGLPLPQEEVAVLLPPGGRAVLDLLVPHQPLPVARAVALAKLDLPAHLEACRAFWRAKLAAGAQIHVPEAAIDERIRAGLLHLDVVAYGREPAGPVLATTGVYSPIGSESSPIIQFMDSMGWHKLAERSLDFFLARQREDGFIQNFGGYQLETGPVLWTLGEHYRYTRDDAWAKRVRPNVLKACEFLLAWRNRNKRPELRGRGYGLQDGKVADPEDFFHSFMLNGLSYVGLQRSAELLARVDPAASKRLAAEARAYRKDIRTAFRESVARSPAIPLGDGSWVPSAPPWSDYRGPVSLYAEGGKWFTHGAFGARDSLIGALYLVIAEVLDAREPEADFLLKSHQALFTVENAGLSQPYYCRHEFIHLKRGETKAYLKTYYNQVAALQDRETYSFWEHYFYASPHKTHEEGWFLMQTRWMLWLEEGGSLAFLTAVPRRWLEDGKEIRLEGVATHFGLATLRVRSELDKGRITAEIRCGAGRGPKSVTVRLPHPAGLRPTRVTGGRYDRAAERVRIDGFTGRARVELRFD
jgi:hypothetical protein